MTTVMIVKIKTISIFSAYYDLTTISFKFNFLISLPRFIFVDVFICFLEVYNYISSMEDMN